jgi:hypothetical protein
MVIGAQTELVREFRNLERKFDCRITWIEMEEDEYRRMRRKKDAMLRKILSGKRISLVGRV